MSTSNDLSNQDKQVAAFNGQGGVQLPVGTNAQRPGNPTAGIIRWNSSTGHIEYRTATTWEFLPTSAELDDKYVDKNDPKILADLDMSGFKVINMGDPTNAKDAINLEYLTARFTAGTGINADTLDGRDSTDFATQFDLQQVTDQLNQASSDLAAHEADFNNPHHVTKAQLGLDQVDNTKDAAKPISTIQQAALDNKVAKTGDTMSFVPGSPNILDMNGMPIVNIGNFTGMVCYFLQNTVPANFVPATGGAYSRTDPKYTRLFAKIGTNYGAGDGSTTFNVPNLIDYFIKGANPSINVGAIQADQIAGHSHALSDPGHGHTGTTSAAGSHQHTINASFRGSGISSNGGYVYPGIGTGAVTSIAPDHTHSVTITASTTGITIGAVTGAATGGETRPKNFALLPCIAL